MGMSGPFLQLHNSLQIFWGVANLKHTQRGQIRPADGDIHSFYGLCESRAIDNWKSSPAKTDKELCALNFKTNLQESDKRLITNIWIRLKCYFNCLWSINKQTDSHTFAHIHSRIKRSNAKLRGAKFFDIQTVQKLYFFKI